LIHPNSFENSIGFDIVRQSLIDGCDTQTGKETMRKNEILYSAKKIEKEWDLISEWTSIQETHAFDFANFGAFDFIDFIGKLDVENNYLQEDELFILWHSVAYFQKAQSFFLNHEQYPNIGQLFKAELDLNPIPKSIQSILGTDGELLPYASSEYGKLSKEIKQLESEIRSLTNSVYSKYKKAGFTAETEISIREDKMVIPIIAEYKRKVKGFVTDVSATGKVIYIEPNETVELNNIVKERIIERRRERIKILRKTTHIIAPFRADLLQLVQLFSTLDITGSKYRLCTNIASERPQLRKGCILDLKNARNPLLWWNKPNEQKKVVPFTLSLDKKQRMVLISGPNAGGKSVVLKTTLLCAYMAQFGLFIPADAESELSIFKNFFIECGDGQNIESGLSTFSAHLNGLDAIVKNSNENTLFGIDEIASGTDPVFAIPIGRSVLETLLRKKALGITTTHFGKLKQWAHQTNEITNAGMEYDTKILEPLFRLRMNVPGNSYAPELMKKSEFHTDTQKRALKLINTKDFKEERLIADLEQKEQEWNRLLGESIKKQDQLDRLLKEYKNLKSQISESKEKIIEQAEQEASRIVAGINKSVETTIKSIKETKADNKVTLEKRKDLSQKIEKQVKRMDALKEKAKPKEVIVPDDEPSLLQEGSIVKNAANEMLGEVIEIRKEKALVAFGLIKMWVNSKQLVVGNGQKTGQGQKPRLKWMKRQEVFKTELDLRGGRGEESLTLVENWLDEAYAIGQHKLKIIHGHGTGVLRKLLREMLKKKSFVKSYGPEASNNGGNGATLIELL
jgi:DNA mismatch repair protein MutS2